MTAGKVSSQSQVYYKLVSFTVSAWFIWLRWGRWRQAESFLISFSIISTAVSQFRREAGEDVKPALDKSALSAAVLHSWACYSTVVENVPTGPFKSVHAVTVCNAKNWILSGFFFLTYFNCKIKEIAVLQWWSKTKNSSWF